MRRPALPRRLLPPPAAAWLCGLILILTQGAVSAESRPYVDYYAYVKYRSADGKPLEPCPLIKDDAEPLPAGEYLFQLVFFPSDEARQKEPWSLLDKPWGALRASLPSGSNTRPLPLVRPDKGSAPQSSEQAKSTNNLWGLTPSDAPTWNEMGQRWVLPLAGVSKSSLSTAEDVDIPFLRVLCASEYVSQGAVNHSEGILPYRLYRVHRLLEAPIAEDIIPVALAVMRRFFAPNPATETEFPNLTALKATVNQDKTSQAGFRRAAYLSREPSKAHQALFARFTGDLDGLSIAAETHIPLSSDLPLFSPQKDDPSSTDQTATTGTGGPGSKNQWSWRLSVTDLSATTGTGCPVILTKSFNFWESSPFGRVMTLLLIILATVLLGLIMLFPFYRKYLPDLLHRFGISHKGSGQRYSDQSEQIEPADQRACEQSPYFLTEIARLRKELDDKDVALWKTLKKTQSKDRESIDAISHRTGALEAQGARLEQRLSALDERLTSLSSRLDTMPDRVRFDRLQQQVADVERKIAPSDTERLSTVVRPGGQGTAHTAPTPPASDVESSNQPAQPDVPTVGPFIAPPLPATGPTLATPGTPVPGYDALRQDLKTRLTTLKVFTEAGWDDLWDGFSPEKRCRFAAQLVGLYLPENLSEGVYDEVDDWLKGAFGGEVVLIRPRAGAQFDDAEHKSVSTVPRERGAFNVVHSLVRAGARCEGKVVRPASVVRVA